MAHLVEQMFSVKETPWHRLGHIVNQAPTAAEAIKLAGLNWKVNEASISRNDGSQPEVIDSHKLLFRDDNGKQLGIVGRDYTPLQNEKAFEFFNPFIESGLASFETAGSLREGKTVWVLAKLNKDPIVIGKDDLVNKYLLLSNGHDGLTAVRVGFTPIRVVCANTLAMSVNAKESKLIRVIHSQHVNTRLDKIQEIVNAADAKFQATAEQYQALAKADVNQEDLKKYVELVFVSKATTDERRKLANDRMVQDIQRLFETGYGQDLKGAKGTYWGLYNAVTQYLSYEKGLSEDSRLNSLWFGQNKNLNDLALKTAVEMVAA
jgi:phage/plasmid-like protein (TIGR03299 family)